MKLFTVLSAVFLLVNLNSTAQLCSGTGGINFQRWNNINGTAVSNLTSNVNYPNNPSSTGRCTLLEMPSNLGNNLGVRMYGYICPPTSGSYTFWVAGDASTELWLSTTNSPTNKVKIAFNTSSTNSRQWTRFSSQKSATISLSAGQQYYVEVLMKESNGSDHVAVGWAKPGQSTSAPSEVIPGTSLMQQLPDVQAPTAPASLTASNITTSTFTLTWAAATDNVGVTGYDVYQNGVKINTATVTTRSYPVTGLTAATSYAYHVVAKDAAGNMSQNSLVLDVTTALPDLEAPGEPTNLQSSIITQNGFNLAWTASTDNVGVSGYDIYQDGVKVNAALVTTTNYKITGLFPGLLYSIIVKAKDAAGNESVGSLPLLVTTLTSTTAGEAFTQRTILTRQRMPHDLVYGPDNNIWFTERFGGTVSFVNPTTSVKRTVLTLGAAMARTGGQDGLMGLALHPEFLAGKPYVYISYTYQSLNATVRKTRIERYTYNSTTQLLESPVTILQDLPGSNDHNSARIAIGPDLKLYYSIGDMGAGQFDNASRPNHSQNLNIYEGKILRLNTEADGLGSFIPADNPYTNAGVPTAVYSLGHRNPQGLVWGKVNGVDKLYSDEHGPFSDDEINVIERGRNYGWPNVIGWCEGNYNGRTTGGYTISSEQLNCLTLNVKEPLRSLFPVTSPPSGGDNMLWPSVAPSGADFYGGDAIPNWQNSLLVTNLKKGTVSRYKLSNSGQDILSDTIHYFRGLGRFRDVVVSPDGLKIYVACDSSGSTSGPTGSVTSTPANPGSILEFTYVPSNTSALYTKLPREAVTDRGMEIYPNPANAYFVVYNYSASENRTFELVDINGRIISRKISSANNTRIETASLANGVYVLKILDKNRNTIRTEKIIVHH